MGQIIVYRNSKTKILNQGIIFFLCLILVPGSSFAYISPKQSASIKNRFQKYQLEKSPQIGQLYQQIKAELPLHIQKELDPLVASEKDQPITKVRLLVNKGFQNKKWIAKLHIHRSPTPLEIEFLNSKKYAVKIDGHLIPRENFDTPKKMIQVIKRYFSEVPRIVTKKKKINPWDIKNRKNVSKKLLAQYLREMQKLYVTYATFQQSQIEHRKKSTSSFFRRSKSKWIAWISPQILPAYASSIPNCLIGGNILPMKDPIVSCSGQRKSSLGTDEYRKSDVNGWLGANNCQAKSGASHQIGVMCNPALFGNVGCVPFAGNSTQQCYNRSLKDPNLIPGLVEKMAKNPDFDKQFGIEKVRKSFDFKGIKGECRKYGVHSSQVTGSAPAISGVAPAIVNDQRATCQILFKQMDRLHSISGEISKNICQSKKQPGKTTTQWNGKVCLFTTVTPQAPQARPATRPRPPMRIPMPMPMPHVSPNPGLKPDVALFDEVQPGPMAEPASHPDGHISGADTYLPPEPADKVGDLEPVTEKSSEPAEPPKKEPRPDTSPSRSAGGWSSFFLIQALTTVLVFAGLVGPTIWQMINGPPVSGSSSSEGVQ